MNNKQHIFTKKLKHGKFYKKTQKRKMYGGLSINPVKNMIIPGANILFNTVKPLIPFQTNESLFEYYLNSVKYNLTYIQRTKKYSNPLNNNKFIKFINKITNKQPTIYTVTYLEGFEFLRNIRFTSYYLRNFILHLQEIDMCNPQINKDCSKILDDLIKYQLLL
jgi:hypothetical protein